MQLGNSDFMSCLKGTKERAKREAGRGLICSLPSSRGARSMFCFPRSLEKEYKRRE
jgi:hypothetical protein